MPKGLGAAPGRNACRPFKRVACYKFRALRWWPGSTLRRVPYFTTLAALPRSLLAWLAAPILERLDTIMTTLEQLQAKAEQLEASIAAANAKADALIALAGQLREQVAALSSSGGATAAQLDELGATLDRGLAAVAEQDAQNAQALQPAAGGDTDPPPAG